MADVASSWRGSKQPEDWRTDQRMADTRKPCWRGVCLETGTDAGIEETCVRSTHTPTQRLKTCGEERAMNDRLLRRREVEEITGLARSSLYRYMQEGDFPRPVRVGPAAVRWRESDIVRWLESRPTARGEVGPLRRPRPSLHSQDSR